MGVVESQAYVDLLLELELALFSYPCGRSLETIFGRIDELKRKENVYDAAQLAIKNIRFE